MIGSGAAGMVARAFRNVTRAIPGRGSRRHGGPRARPRRILERDLVAGRGGRSKYRQDRVRRARSTVLVFGIFVLLIGFGALALLLATT